MPVRLHVALVAAVRSCALSDRLPGEFESVTKRPSAALEIGRRDLHAQLIPGDLRGRDSGVLQLLGHMGSISISKAYPGQAVCLLRGEKTSEDVMRPTQDDGAFVVAHRWL